MRFTIRDLLWLTALVAVTLGLLIAWSRDSWQLATEINDKNQFHHDEMMRLERELTEIWLNALEKKEREINAAWEKAIRERLEEPATDSAP
jgi:hypothetical protein